MKVRQDEDRTTGRRMSAANRAIAEGYLDRYPTKRAALLMVMRVVEAEFGCIDDDGVVESAEICGVTPAEALGVLRFYFHFNTPGKGTYRLMVCRTFPCDLRGARGLGEKLKQKLGIDYGQTTADGKFSLEKVECLGACDKAPLFQCNDTFHEMVDDAGVDEIIDGLRAGDEAKAGQQDFILARIAAVPDMVKHYSNIKKLEV